MASEENKRSFNGVDNVMDLLPPMNETDKERKLEKEICISRAKKHAFIAFFSGGVIAALGHLSLTRRCKLFI